MIRIPHATWSTALTQLDVGAFVDVLLRTLRPEILALGPSGVTTCGECVQSSRYVVWAVG